MDLDSLLVVIGNPTRRQILRKLVKETHYPLQLSKELSVSQQAIMKHLKVLEENDLVRCVFRRSESGPPRKCYVATQSLSIIIDLSPEHFSEELRFHVRDEDRVIEGVEDTQALRTAENLRIKLAEFTRSIASINSRLEAMAGERDLLIEEKERAMHYVNRIVDTLCEEYTERKVLRYLIAENDFSIPAMSEMLNMRESEIDSILKRLEEDGLLMIRT